MKSVSIITVNFNHPNVTEALFESIAKTNTYSNIEIIVVDNASKENPIPAWKQKYPEINGIRSDKNTGFAGGNNIGIRAAKGDYLFLVNNDTEFTEGLVATLVNAMDNNPAIGVISPKIKYFDNTEMLQYAGYTPVDMLTGRNACIGQFETDKGQYDHLTGPTGYAHGAAMMVRREAMEKAGLMFENYFLYYEELDWCERIKKAGYEVHVNMQALIYHKESVSVGKKSAIKEYFMNRNRILFIRRNAPLAKRLLFYPYFLFLVAPRNILAYIKEGNPAFITMIAKAIWWNVTHGTESEVLGYKLNN